MMTAGEIPPIVSRLRGESKPERFFFLSFHSLNLVELITEMENKLVLARVRERGHRAKVGMPRKGSLW